MLSRIRLPLLLALAVALVSTPTLATAAPAAVDVPTAVSPIPRSELCNRPLRRLDLYVGSSRLTLPNTLTLLGESRPIDLQTFTIGSVPYQDPSRVLWYRSLLWLAIAAVDEAEHGNHQTAGALANEMVRAAEAYPDPGSATPERLAWANAIGWDEGTAFRRAQALLCLSAYTGAERLRPLLTMHAEALVDPLRYMGPPNRAVHNHGMLANLVLIDIAQVLNAPHYRDLALNRLKNDYATQFSPAGWAVESATAYQTVNIKGWTEVADEMRLRGLSGDADALTALLGNATTMAAAMVSPTGVPELVGNTRPTDIMLKPPVVADRPLLLVDKDANVATGRWSWTDRTTGWWTAMNRFRRGAHGHDDHTAVTWQANGVPVLVDVGQPDYDRNAPSDWARSPYAHNRSVPDAATVRDTEKIRKLRVSRNGLIDRIAMETSDLGHRQAREVLIDDKRKSMQVTDQTGSAQTQHWHLAPVWRAVRVRGDVAEFVGPQGRRLVVTAPGASMRLLSGSTNPMGGWITTGFEKTAPAPELVVSGGDIITTTFQLSRAGVPTTGPRPPRVDPRTTQPRSRSVVLRWTAPATARATATTATDPSATAQAKRKPKPRRLPVNQRITGYRVQQLGDDGLWRTIQADSRRPNPLLKVRGLVNGTKYRFRVAALTAVGTTIFGRASKPFTPCTSPAGITEPVVSVAGRKNVRLSWTPPEADGGCPVTAYEITAGKELWRPRSSRAVLPLEKGRLKVRVAAVNSAGKGKAVALVIRRAKNTVTVR